MKQITSIFYTIFLVFALMIFGVNSVQAGPCELAEFDPDNFNDPLTIDNIYWPMEPVTIFVYKPVPNEENVINTITVTNSTKTITIGSDTIECRVVYDIEEVDGELSEETWDWYAQDDDGNIWYFGEETYSYFDDEGNPLITPSDEGSWEAGVDGALPGIVVPADPKVGECYQQEFYEDEAEDTARVLKLNAKVSLATDESDLIGDLETEYDNCLETKEWTPLEPGNIEHKYYNPGVGLVYIEELKEKTVKVELVELSGP